MEKRRPLFTLQLLILSTGACFQVISSIISGCHFCKILQIAIAKGFAAKIVKKIAKLHILTNQLDMGQV